jgi:hypothetical protein
MPIEFRILGPLDGKERGTMVPPLEGEFHPCSVCAPALPTRGCFGWFAPSPNSS